MNIRVISDKELSQAKSGVSIIREPPLVLYPDVHKLYLNRHHRLVSLSKDSEFHDFLAFYDKLVVAQIEAIKKSTIDLSIKPSSSFPLSVEHFKLTADFMPILDKLLSAALNINPQIDQTINNIKTYDSKQLLEIAYLLLAGDFEQVKTNEAIFIWTALSTYYVQIASILEGYAIKLDDDKSLFPLCGSHPVASVIQTGKNNGLRYLHCSLCETQWYIPRVRCTSCNNLKNIIYYALDDKQSAIKTECCIECHSYLKIINLELNPSLDVIADDINSLPLDMEMDKLGLAKSGLNPALFSQS